MSITYCPDVGIHGLIETSVDQRSLQAEPSLTLCSPSVFAKWAGPISRSIFSELAGSTGFERIAARADRDSTLSIRISVYVVWLEEGDFPSHRPDWHIDRVGGLRKKESIELVDLRDTTEFPSFLLTSIFLPSVENGAHLDSRSSEFLLAKFRGQSSLLWADMREMHIDIDSWLAANPNPSVLKVGNRTIASFSPRTVHRPGRAATSGWSYLMRLGLYTATEPCSPYPDHMVFFNPVWNEQTRATVFRRVGSTTAETEPKVRSVALTLAHGERAARDFVREASLNVAQSPQLVDEAIQSAVRLASSKETFS